MGGKSRSVQIVAKKGILEQRGVGKGVKREREKKRIQSITEEEKSPRLERNCNRNIQGGGVPQQRKEAKGRL